MWILLVFVVFERFETLFQVGAHWWWYVVVDARLVVSVLVVFVVGEVRNFLWAFYACGCALKAVERLYREAVDLGRECLRWLWSSGRCVLNCMLKCEINDCCTRRCR